MLQRFRRLALLALLMCGGMRLCSGDEFRPAPVTLDTARQLVELWRKQATLRDVCFVDTQRGWAVGDHGAIWHTQDAGQHWQLQNAPTTVSLRGVHFIDADRGWAVGGVTSPQLWTSQATLLRTIDGGKTWHEQLALVPALTGVHFFSPQQGIAWGRGSGGYPLGLFASDDGGRNWYPAATGTISSWQAAAFADQSTGLLVDAAGHTARIRHGDWLASESDSASWRDAVLTRGGEGWLVGAHGAIAHSFDHGASWKDASPLPSPAATHLSWHTIAKHQQHLWVAGAPGSVLLHSADGGANWQGQATGNTLPLQAIQFADAQTGWAVGAAGTILHTADGGTLWQQQQQAAECIDLLVIADEFSHLPLATLGKAALVDNRLVVAHCWDESINTPPDARERQREVASLLGCLEVESSPAQDERLPQLIRLLRTWRPRVLVVPRGDDVLPLAQQAIEEAADADAYPVLRDQIALPAWQVHRLYAQLPNGERGTHGISAEEGYAAGAQSLAATLTQVQGLLSQNPTEQLPNDSFQLVASLVGEPLFVRDDLLAGVARTVQTETPIPPDPLARQRQRRLLEKRRNLRNILRAASSKPAVLSQISTLTADLDPDSTAALYLELADEFAAAGHWELKAQTLELLVRRYPDSLWADQAQVWLVQYFASGETAHRARQMDPIATEQLATTADGNSTSNPSFEAGVQQASAQLSVPQNDRFTRAVQITQHIAHTRPLLYAEPQLRVPWARAEIARGDAPGAQKYVESLALRYPGDAWFERGQGERWLANPADYAAPTNLIISHSSDERPHLDGMLDDPLWEGPFTKLDAKSTQAASELRFAHDAEFLYLALRVTKLSGASYVASEAPRTYDADLSGRDRVRLWLDVDRDYATGYELSIDHRGWTNDACWGDASWNPQWFVAAADNAEHWTVEAAIPWRELVPIPPQPNDAWVLGVSRVVSDADPEPSTKFRLLQFR